jgi:hypothetical protein
MPNRQTTIARGLWATSLTYQDEFLFIYYQILEGWWSLPMYIISGFFFQQFKTECYHITVKLFTDAENNVSTIISTGCIFA